MSDDIPDDEFIYPQFVPLTNGGLAIVDHWAYESIVAMGVWTANERNYVACKSSSGRCYLFMHKIVLELAGVDEDNLEVGHRNGDNSDNRLSNLRPATPEQSQVNQPSHSRSSRFNGTYKHKRGRWQARYKLDGKERSLGYFAAEEDAARAYDKKMFDLWGHWARLNFPLKLFYETEGPPRIKRPMVA